MASPPPKSSGNRGKLGPYSKRLQRGAIGNICDGRSSLGRFIRHLEAELVAHVGGKPSITQRMMIDRLIKIRLQLDLLDEKLAKGDWTPHDCRTHGGLLNAYRLTARELGLEAAAERVPSLAEHLEQRRRAAAAAAE
jgi:hypothetical protein